VTHEFFQALSVGHLRSYFYLLALPLSEQVRPSDIVYMIAITRVGKLGPLWWTFDVLSCMWLGNPDLFSCFIFSERFAPLQCLHLALIATILTWVRHPRDLPETYRVTISIIVNIDTSRATGSRSASGDPRTVAN
jgi:hypothetical protein